MKITEIGAYEAKTHWSRILAKVQQGRTFYITRRGRRMAELRPAPADGGRPAFGCDPFDRLIIAQALVERIPIVSGDPEFQMYGARIV